MEKLQKQREHLHETLHPFPQEAGIVFVFIFVHLCICTTTQGEHLLELFHPFPPGCKASSRGRDQRLQLCWRST